LLLVAAVPTNLTGFVQEYMKDQLKPYLDSLQVGFSSKMEKSQANVRFDIYAYSRPNRVFLIWELEMCNCRKGCITNVRKVKTILDREWLPHVHMFHVFSPFCVNDARPCLKAAKNLRKKYELRFTYQQFQLSIPYDDLYDIYDLFERHRLSAERKYGQRLRVHIGKIVRQSIDMFRG